MSGASICLLGVLVAKGFSQPDGVGCEVVDLSQVVDEMDKHMPHMDLDQLFVQFLRSRAAQGMVAADSGEVEPFQSVPLQITDPATAFREATEAAGYFSGVDKNAWQSLAAPPDWPALVRQQSVVAIPFCLANFPHMLCEVTPLLRTDKLSTLSSIPGRTAIPTDFLPWGKAMIRSSKLNEGLFASAALRVAGDFASARQLLDNVREKAPADWAGLLLNEEAALAWHSGDIDRAQMLWDNHPEKDNAALLFNRGIARLFKDKRDDAAPLFESAAHALPQSSSWHHLARLYLTVAQGV